jgi:PKD domain/Right handed beta helix region
MRLKRSAAVSVLCLVSGTLVPVTVHADTPTVSTLYVNNGTYSDCSDSGTGTEAVPFCTVQAAAAVVEPGQTVQIEYGNYAGQVTLTRSGTAAEPIKFVGNTNSQNRLQGDANFSIGQPPAGTTTQSYGLEIDGASYVTVSGLEIYGGEGTVGMVDADNDRLTMDFLTTPQQAQPNVAITGSSQADTLDRNQIQDGAGGISLGAGVTGTVISENWVESTTPTAISADAAAGTVITGNTVVANNRMNTSAISLTGGSTGSTVENNIVEGTGAAWTGVVVDAASATGTTLDYNIVYPVPGSSGTVAYSWAGTNYATAAALYAAVGQGAHDLNANPMLSGSTALLEGSPAIDSADANAPGEYSTDFYGNPRDDDPSDPDTGTGVGYYDRGAVEQQDPLAITAAASAPWGGTTLTDTFTVTQTAAPWSSDVTYVYNFGDGTSTTTTATTATHTFTAAGSYTTTVTATDADYGQASANAYVKVGNGDGYDPTSPTRVLDTRAGTGTNGVVAKVAPGKSVQVKVAGVGAVPAAGVGAVVLNLTATDDAGSGFVSVYPDGGSVPTASSLNYASNVTVANLITVQVGADGMIDFYNGGTLAQPIDLIADLEGYYAPGAGDTFDNYTPTRILDTRGGGSLAAGQTMTFNPVNAFLAAVKADQLGTVDVTAVMLNVTVTNTHGSGFISVYPGGTTEPNSSSINYAAGQTVPNMVIVPVAADGDIELTNSGTTAGQVDLVIDFYAVYSGASQGLGFTPVAPARLVDTRSGLGVGAAGPIPGGGAISQPGSNFPQIPAAAEGVMLNVTATQPQSAGVVQVAGPYSNAALSNLNYTTGETVSNGAFVGWYPASSSAIIFYNEGAGSTQLIADLYGYFW